MYRRRQGVREEETEKFDAVGKGPSPRPHPAPSLTLRGSPSPPSPLDVNGSVVSISPVDSLELYPPRFPASPLPRSIRSRAAEVFPAGTQPYDQVALAPIADHIHLHGCAAPTASSVTPFRKLHVYFSILRFVVAWCTICVFPPPPPSPNLCTLHRTGFRTSW